MVVNDTTSVQANVTVTKVNGANIDFDFTPAMTQAQLEDALQPARFVPCGASQEKSAGWVEPRGEEHGPLVEVVDGHWLLRQMVEVRSVPGAVVKRKVEEQVKHIEASTGRKPGRKEIRDLIRDLKREGKTVFVNSHLLGELEMICDRMAILMRGRVVRQGSLEELTIESCRYEIAVAGNLIDNFGLMDLIHRLGGTVALTPDGVESHIELPTRRPQLVQPVVDALRQEHGEDVILRSHNLRLREGPHEAAAPAVPHALGFAGKSALEKREEIATALRSAGQDAAVDARFRSDRSGMEEDGRGGLDG